MAHVLWTHQSSGNVCKGVINIDPNDTSQQSTYPYETEWEDDLHLSPLWNGGHQADVCPRPHSGRCGCCGSQVATTSEGPVEYECTSCCLICGGTASPVLRLYQQVLEGDPAGDSTDQRQSEVSSRASSGHQVNYMKSTSTLGEPGQVTTIAKSENRTMGPTFNAGDFPSVANAQTKASGWVRAVSEPLFAFPFKRKSLTAAKC
ncbi:hypothetical protein HPB49_023005 [Dermacentor silvarum]|uniref:Uncharacterized protein n=1 Tax=Dermacentor silvarum TaxID=543639 RepID=A0ACB8C5V8_DERSI|nr:hypothetical protein HPB49_023005 [Dermacentor silvarum]